MAPCRESRIALPAPGQGSGALEHALRMRRSRRAFSSRPLDLASTSRLLWAVQGVVDADGRRTAPSAGALYPLETRLVASRVENLMEGLYRYQPHHHALEPVTQGRLADALCEAARWQDVVVRAAALIAISAVPERTRSKYGERALRYVWMEAGHAAQNAYLQATALGIGAVALGAFRDVELARVLELGPEEIPLYLLALGAL